MPAALNHLSHERSRWRGGCGSAGGDVREFGRWLSRACPGLGLGCSVHLSRKPSGQVGNRFGRNRRQSDLGSRDQCHRSCWRGSWQFANESIRCWSSDGMAPTERFSSQGYKRRSIKSVSHWLLEDFVFVIVVNLQQRYRFRSQRRSTEDTCTMSRRMYRSSSSR